MVETIIGVGVTLLLAILGTTWMLGSRLSKLETLLEPLPGAVGGLKETVAGHGEVIEMIKEGRLSVPIHVAPESSNGRSAP